MINKIQGTMLESNLLLDGQDLAIETDLLYVSSTGRIGIQTNLPRSDFDVNGVGWISNLRFSNDQILVDSGAQLTFEIAGQPANFTGSKLINVADPVDLQDVVTVNYLNNAIGGIQSDRIISSNSELVINKTGGLTDLTFSPNGVTQVTLNDTQAIIGLETQINNNFDVIGTTRLNDIIIANTSISTLSGSASALTLTSDSGLVNLVGNLQLNSTTADKILFTDSGNNVSTSTNLTFNGSDLVLNGQALIDDVLINSNTINSSTGLNITTTDLVLNGTSKIDLNTTAAGNITMSLDQGIVDINTTSSIKIPVGTTVERPLTPAAGYMRFNSILGRAEIHDGIDWNGFSPDFAGITVQEIIPDGVSQTYGLNEPATSATIIVSLNGIVQEPDNAYNVVGSNIVFAAPPLPTDIVSIRFLSALSTVSAITDAYGDTKVEADNSIITLDISGTNVITIDNSSIVVDKSILPLTPLGADLGSATNKFSIVYTNQIFTTQINGVPADVAENFTADKPNYEPGTVMILDGEAEVTPCTEYADQRVAGVISTDPAYILNAEADNPVPIGLAGRVPCKVVGPVRRGDLLTTSSIEGRAVRYENDGIYRPGVILGKALESTNEQFDTILIMITMM